jgi:hypothetical protein
MRRQLCGVSTRISRQRQNRLGMHITRKSPAQVARAHQAGLRSACVWGLVAGAGFAVALTGCSSASKKGVLEAGGVCFGRAFSTSGEGSVGIPQTISAPLPAAITARYAVFRRASRPEDRPPGTPGIFARELGEIYQLASYYSSGVRSVSVGRASRRYLVVPAFARQAGLPPANCISSQRLRKLQEQQARRATEPVYCIVEVRARRIRPVSSCTPFVAIEEGGEVFGEVSTRGRQIIELVPDSVALVRIVRSAGVMAVRTSENTFRFTPPPLPRGTRRQLQKLGRQIATPNLPNAQRERATNEYNRRLAESAPKQIEWFNAAGQRIRVISASDVASGPHSVGDLRAPIQG